jgi:hypothetical protein
MNEIIDFLKDKIKTEEDEKRAAEAAVALINLSSLIEGERPCKVNVEYNHSIENGGEVVFTVTYRLRPSRSEMKATITNALNNDEVEVLPCAACDARVSEPKGPRLWGGSNFGPWKDYIQCSNCGARGPEITGSPSSRATPAIVAWNKMQLQETNVKMERKELNREELIRKLVDLGKGGDPNNEPPVISRGFPVTGATIRSDESGRKWIEIESGTISAGEPEPREKR